LAKTGLGSFVSTERLTGEKEELAHLEALALNCLVFEKIAFFYFGDRLIDKQKNKRTDGQLRCTKPLSLSPAAA